MLNIKEIMFDYNHTRAEITRILGKDYPSILKWSLGESWKNIPISQWGKVFNINLKTDYFASHQLIGESMRQLLVLWERRIEN